MRSPLRKAILGALVALSLLPANAQVNTQLSTTQSKLTMTGAFLPVPGLPGNSLRGGCTIQNNGTHTMYVYFGGSAPADNTTSFQLSASQSLQCLVGGDKVVTSAVFIEGTSGDVAVYAYQ